MDRAITKLSSLADLDRVIEASSETPIFLFKHSNSCGVSTRALRAFQSFAQETRVVVGCSVVVAQEACSVSDEVASRFAIGHETPQVILVRDGGAVWNASHFGITVDSLHDALRHQSAP